MWRLLVFLLHWQWFVPSVQTLSINQERGEYNSVSEWSPRNLGRMLQHCLSGAEKLQCLGTEGERLLDAAARDNSTWQLSEYLSIEPEEHESGESKNGRSARGLTAKLLQLAQGRALRMRLPRQLTISNAIDDFGNELGLDQGTVVLIDDKIDKFIASFGSFDVQAATATDNHKDKNKDKHKKKKTKKKKKDKDKKKKNQSKKKKKNKRDKHKMKKKKKKKGKDKMKKGNKSKNCFNKTGRKKKDKDKNMAMMGGMIMLATFAQMFLGKVILIAGSAFVMAKIALAISLLGSLKKGSTGHSGSPEHVIVASSSPGHSHESGWHRSMPTHSYSPSQLKAPSEDSDHGQNQAYYAYETEHQLNRRHLAAETTPTTVTPRSGFL